MRTFLWVTALALTASSLVIPSARAQGPNALLGAWELTEGTDADSNPREDTGMLIFSDGHYSWIRASRGDRPSYASQDEATDAQKLAAFGSFGANAGSYTVSGSTLTRDPAVAKNPYVYAPDRRIVNTFTIEGSTLTITSADGAIAKYTRLD